MCPRKYIRWDYKIIQTLDLLPSNSSMFCLCLCSSFPENTHRYTHRTLRCSHTHAGTYLTDGLPGGKPHTLCREEKQQGKVERKKWRSRGKVWGRERKRGKSEKQIKTEAQRKKECMSKTKEKKKRAWGPRTEPLQTVLMYVSWVSSYTCPFNPSISEALASSVLSGSSFISPSQGLISPCYTYYIFRVHTKLDFSALERENVLCVKKYGYYVSMIHKTHRKRIKSISEVSGV